jgi:phosphatidylserine/phosphatidylglycerophosphate/cardiolipin synthase-like enzyme
MQEHPELKVRIIVDGMTFLPGMGLGTNLERLKACGAEIVVHPFFSTMTTQHRKLFVVDGERAFVGGTNLKSNYFASREYQALYKRAVEEGGDAVDRFLEVKERSTDPHAHDCGIEITGPSVAHLQAGFIQNWLQYGRGFEEALDDDDVVKRYFPPAPAASPRPGGATKLTHSVPWGVSQTRAAFADFIRSAKQKLDLEITYIVVPEFVQLLLEAADRGVHVRLVTNSLSSTDFAPAVHELRRIGRRLFDHERIALFETEGYTHVKLAVADERFVLVTTANPERLSWERSFDETLVMDDRDLARSCLTRVLEHDMRDDRSTRLQRGPQTGGWFAFAKQMFWSAVSDLILPVYRHDDERPLPPELQPSANR